MSRLTQQQIDDIAKVNAKKKARRKRKRLAGPVASAKRHSA